MAVKAFQTVGSGLAESISFYVLKRQDSLDNEINTFLVLHR
jgi:hypothetical protein